MNEPVKVPLSRPLRVITELRTELFLREPCGADLVKSGYPIKMGETVMEIDASAMSKLIAISANLSPSIVERMPACDWQACSVVMTSFFRATGDPGEILRRYFELARWWGGALDHVMSLSLSEMILYWNESVHLAAVERAAAERR